MDPEGDLDQHLGHLIRLLADGAAPVGRLAPGGPVEAGVDPDAGRALLPGQAVGGLEAHVAQEDVHLEALLDGLALQEGPFEGAPVRADELGEDVVQHAGAEATVLPVSANPEPRRLSPWLDRRVIAYAHQGGAWEAPSSTLYAIGGALDAGATAIELDVHATRDGHLVVCHDATVDRTTNSAGVIAQMTWDELRTLDNAYWWAPGADVSPGLDPDRYPYRGRAPEDRRFCIALLGGGARRLSGRRAQSRHQADSPGGTALRAGPGRHAPKVRANRRRHRRLVPRHGHRRLLDIRPGNSDLRRNRGGGRLLSGGPVGEDPEPLRHVALQVPARYGDLTLVDDRFVEVAHQEGLAVHVWTIEDERLMEQLCGLGVDGIITDRPSILAGVLERLGCSWQPHR